MFNEKGNKINYNINGILRRHGNKKQKTVK